MKTKDDMTKEEHEAQIAKIYVEIEKMRAEVTKMSKESFYYPLVVGSGATLAIVAVLNFIESLAK